MAGLQGRARSVLQRGPSCCRTARLAWPSVNLSELQNWLAQQADLVECREFVRLQRLKPTALSNNTIDSVPRGAGREAWWPESHGPGWG